MIAEDAIRLGILAQHEDGVRLLAIVLPDPELEIAIDTLDPAREADSVARVVQDANRKIGGCGTWHSPHNNSALMLCECPPEPFIWGRWVDESVEERRAIAIRQQNGLALRDRLARGFRQRV